MKTKLSSKTVCKHSSRAGSISAMPVPVPEGCTVGIDLGDKQHSVCVLDGAGKVLKQDRIANDRPALKVLAQAWPKALFVLEAGTHSPWISRHLEGLGCRVLVANPRKVRAIYKNERKSDDRDAEQLARIARVDETLLYPVEHGTEQAQHDLLGIKLRDALVRARVDLINAVRFTLKSLGHRVANPSSSRFHKSVREEVPAAVLEVIEPVISVLAEITERIKQAERAITRLARENYPAALRLQQIAGVGPVTSLCFVLKVGDAQRFGRVRDIGAYLGLTPRRDQSGGSDKELGITKCGDAYLRRLLVNCAQYVMGPFGPPSALRSCGERLAGTTAKERKRAVIAVARKLAVLMLSLWRSGGNYEPRAPESAASGPLAA